MSCELHAMATESVASWAREKQTQCSVNFHGGAPEAARVAEGRVTQRAQGIYWFYAVVALVFE